eukprot:3802002-Lingulodinium_polyedra.AAC.1
MNWVWRPSAPRTSEDTAAVAVWFLRNAAGSEAAFVELAGIFFDSCLKRRVILRAAPVQPPP